MTSRVDLEAPLTDPASFTPLQDLSGALVGLVSAAAPAIVSVHSHRSRSSGFVWRSGLIVTADEALADEGDVAVGLPDGRTLPARVAGRDPTTDIACFASNERMCLRRLFTGRRLPRGLSPWWSAPRMTDRRRHSAWCRAQADPGGACAGGKLMPGSNSQ